MTTSERLTRARMRVILHAPFFGTLLMRLKMVRDDAQPTMCTDGVQIRYNEKFVAELDDAQLCGVLAHEVAHCAQGHVWRIGPRDPERFNHAADYTVNELLTNYVKEAEAQFLAQNQQRGSGARFLPPWTLPAGSLIDPAYANLSAEEIYDRLPRNNGGGMGAGQQSGAGAGPGSPGHGQPGAGTPQGGGPSPGTFEAPAGASPEADKEAAQEWTIAVTQAAMAARMRGSLPACLERFIDELLQPKVPWREVLREFIRRQSRDDYRWTRPNRRYLASGFILPSLRGERMGKLVIAVDTSASIGEHELAEFQAEVQAALDECAPEALEVIYCDAEVNGTEEFMPGDAVRLHARGGGGTAFEPVFDHVEEHHAEPPAALIYLTDMYGSFPKQEPDYPVLWASTSEVQEAPFGQVVAVK